MQVLNILTRRYLPLAAFEDSVRFHEAVIGQPARLRFDYAERGLRLAQVGNLLLIAGDESSLAPIVDTHCTCLVDDLEAFGAWLRTQGADVLRAEREVPTGWNLLARHPDGTVVEYVQHRHPNPADRLLV